MTRATAFHALSGPKMAAVVGASLKKFASGTAGLTAGWFAILECPLGAYVGVVRSFFFFYLFG